MNIAHRIREVSKKFPEKTAVIHPAKSHSITFREFEERSNQLANRFARLGITPGMRTLLFVKPCTDFTVITFALFKLGAVPVLIDPGMGLENLLKSIKQVRPEAMVSVGVVHWIRRFKRDPFSSVRIKVSLSRVGGATSYLYQGLADEGKEFSPLEVESKTPSCILFTSGGTGIPKGVIYTHGILNAQTDALKEMFQLDATGTDLPGFPLFALFTLAMGMTSVIPDMDPTRPAKCDPAKLVKNILDHHCTFVAGSPAIWERVGRYCVANKLTLPTVKHLVMFGAPVRTEIHEIFKHVLVNGDTYTPYGATESLPVSLISGSEVLAGLSKKTRDGEGTCIGRAAPGITLKIIKATDIPETRLSELPNGEIGEIVVTGMQVTEAYFDMPEETNNAKIVVGGKLWHRMGDLGYLDRDGRLWFLGRKAHRVKTLDAQFYPIRVEAIFNQHPAIRRTALIKLMKNGAVTPGLAIERFDRQTHLEQKFLQELEELAQSSSYTNVIKDFYLHPGFPVDVRHNIKIDRNKLSEWAQNAR